ncbi:TPA: BRO family protein [Streptococcus suis]
MKRNYSKVIEEMRTTHGLNLVAIGQRIGTDPRTVGKWATGKYNPSPKSRQKLNKLYREVKQNMTTQVSIFEEVNENGRYLQVIHTDNFHGHPLDVYGDFENPLFMAREVAEMIEYSKTSQGYYDVQSMLRKVDEDEKIKGIPLEGTTETFRSGQTMWFLTEYGLYEVLMRSSKPKAKEFRKVVKNILKEIRTQGYYMQGKLIQDQPTQPAIELNSDMAYIKNRLAELQSMTTMADIKVGLAKTYRIAELMED